MFQFRESARQTRELASRPDGSKPTSPDVATTTTTTTTTTPGSAAISARVRIVLAAARRLLARERHIAALLGRERHIAAAMGRERHIVNGSVAAHELVAAHGTSGAAHSVVTAQRHCPDARGEHAVQPRPGQPDGARGGAASAPLLPVLSVNGAADSRRPLRVAHLPRQHARAQARGGDRGAAAAAGRQWLPARPRARRRAV